MSEIEPLEPRLLLVSCNRPADIMAALGSVPAEGLELAAASAVLCSWEERFWAVPAALMPGSLTLAVGAPSPNSDHALRVAAENYASGTVEPLGRPGALRDLASSLSREEAGRAGSLAEFQVTPRVWDGAVALVDVLPRP